VKAVLVTHVPVHQTTCVGVLKTIVMIGKV